MQINSHKRAPDKRTQWHDIMRIVKEGAVEVGRNCLVTKLCSKLALLGTFQANFLLSLNCFQWLYFRIFQANYIMVAVQRGLNW